MAWLPRGQEGFAAHFLNGGKTCGPEERRGEEETRTGSGRHDQEAAEIDFGRRRQNPQGRGEDGHDQCDGDRWKRTARKRHADRNDVENENAKPDGRRGFAFPDAQANEHERQQRHVAWPGHLCRSGRVVVWPERETSVQESKDDVPTQPPPKQASFSKFPSRPPGRQRRPGRWRVRAVRLFSIEGQPGPGAPPRRGRRR